MRSMLMDITPDLMADLEMEAGFTQDYDDHQEDDCETRPEGHREGCPIHCGCYDEN